MDTGALVMQNGSTSALLPPTMSYHCLEGNLRPLPLYNYTKQVGLQPKPVFDAINQIITLQDVYGTSGLCFVGTIQGKLESLGDDDWMMREIVYCAEFHRLSPALPDALSPSGGDVGGLSKDHGWVQRLCNLRQWLKTPPQLRDWLVGYRLFNSGHDATTADEIERLGQETCAVLKEASFVED
mmetsp:Transcript_17111/g.28424  ORF Transcript_17111/g.28424 Transcript_17111/m.28424 type:complete len:183 (+) Transcript_17111:297-845(+)